MSQKTFDNLRNEGYTGALQDMIKQKLSELGYGSLFEQLGSEGYTGALNDRLLQKAIDNGYTTVSAYLTVEGLFAQVQRFITEFLSSTNSFGAATDTIVAPAGQDFSFSCSFSCGNQSTFTILGNSANFLHHIQVQPTKIEVRISGTRLSFTGSWQDNIFHTLTVDRNGTTGAVTITVDGVTVNEDASATSTAAFEVDNLYRESTDYSDGFVIDLTGSVNGAQVIDCPLDEGPSIPYFANRAATLGSELWTGSAVSLGLDWIDNQDGSYSLDGTQTTSRTIDLASGITAGASFLVTYTLDHVAGGGRILVGGTAGTNRFSSGRYEEIITATSTGTVDFLGFSDFNGIISNFSFREIPAATPYITKENIDPTQTVLYTQVSDGWTGPELWTFGSYTFDGTEPAYDVVIGNDAVIPSGSIVRYSTNYSISSGTAHFRIGDLLTTAVSGDGTLSGDQAAITNTRMTWQTVTVPTQGTVSTNTTVKRFLEVV